MLELFLKRVDVGGIYGDPPRLPERMRWLHPGAADSLIVLQKVYGRLICSDVFRSPEASLQAASEKRGVMPPGFSGHNFGLSIDVDVEQMLRLWSCSYEDLTDRLEGAGWFCHRRDLKENASEWWHFNFLGIGGGTYLKEAKIIDPRSWSKPVEAKIIEVYGNQLILAPSEAQMALKTLRYYGGAIDGKIGSLTRQAIAAFRRAWRLGDDGELTPQTQRVLAVVSARRREVA